jgi:hypothetical protein
MRFFYPLDTFDADKDGCHDQSKTDHDGRNRLSFSMPVRVLFIGRLDRKLKSEKHNRGTDNIGEGLNAIGDQSKRVPQKSSRTFERRQHQI